MRKYLGNTFSPMMLAPGRSARITEILLAEVTQYPDFSLTSVVGHEVTAKVLSILLRRDVAFNRVNLVLDNNDVLFCIIPNFRADVAREFTSAEVEAAGYRCFRVAVF